MKYVDGYYKTGVLRLADHDSSGYYTVLYEVPYHTLSTNRASDRWRWDTDTQDRELTGNRLIADLKVLKW